MVHGRLYLNTCNKKYQTIVVMYHLLNLNTEMQRRMEMQFVIVTPFVEQSRVTTNLHSVIRLSVNIFLGNNIQLIIIYSKNFK